MPTRRERRAEKCIGSWWARSSGAALLLLLFIAPASAQVDTAVIVVSTRDSAGRPLPGATVRALNLDTGLERVVVSSTQGEASLPALPLGRYTVIASLDGFATVRQDDLMLRVGQSLRLVMTLLMEVEETITVTAVAPIVDVFRSDTSTNITAEQIEELPTASRDFQDLAYVAPGVQPDRSFFRFSYGSPVLGSAGNASQTTVMVDGVDFTDQSLGQARSRFSQDAVREFRVINNRFDVEIGSSAAGALSVVTKSGGNDVRGSVYGFYRSDALRASGELEIGDQEYSRYHAGFTLGGPIARDRTHFFVSFEHIDQSALGPFRPGGLYEGLAQDIPHPVEQQLFLASLNHQPNMQHSLGLKLVAERYREENFRAGGVCDLSCGMGLGRDNWNIAAGHTWVVSDRSLNELRMVAGRKEFEEPNNSDLPGQWFSFGFSLQTGANYVGDQLMVGDYYEVRDTLHLQLERGRSTHDIKLGGSLRLISERWDFPFYAQGLLIWATDFSEGPFALPFTYNFGSGSGEATIDTTLVGLYVQDDWRPRPDLSVSLGVRYDLDTDGNNPDFSHPNSPGDRDVDRDNFQPRIGFVWDLSGRGSSLLRGGVGRFTGRYLLVPAFTELQLNGTSGRLVSSRINGSYLCIQLGIPLEACPFPALDPENPQVTGVPLNPDSWVLQPSLAAPEALQASLGFAQRIGKSNLYLEFEALYGEGDDEIIVRNVNWAGNSNPGQVDPDWNAIYMYTNEGRSEYTALIASLRGTIRGGQLLTASLTWGDKMNISDDFSPNTHFSDPADVEGEWGRARSDQRWSAVLSGIFTLPWGITVAPIYLCSSGLPWSRLLGYDYNGDLVVSDRAPGIPRNGEDGPPFRMLNLRLAKTIRLGARQDLELIVEGFNVLNTTNYQVDSIDNAEFRQGPTLRNPDIEFVENPNFGNYRATAIPRLIQLGLRFHF